MTSSYVPFSVDDVPLTVHKYPCFLKIGYPQNGSFHWRVIFPLQNYQSGAFLVFFHPSSDASAGAAGEHTGLAILAFLGILAYPVAILTWAPGMSR